MTPAASWWPMGPQAWQGLLLACSIVFGLVLAVLVVVLARRPAGPARLGASDPQAASGHKALHAFRALAAILAMLPVLIVAWVFVQAANRGAASSEPLRIEVVARQWTWSARYLDDGGVSFSATDNRIRVPVGRPVEVELRSADVFHSLWIPALAARAEVVPGSTARLRFEARHPGVYHGRCDAVCGPGSEQMNLVVVAEEVDAFEAWLRGPRGADVVNGPAPADANTR